jgi:tetratricopeptide (TPR) repeat protein
MDANREDSTRSAGSSSPHPTLQIEIPIELEAQGFHRMDQLQQRSQRKPKIGVLLASFVLFLAAYSQVFPVEKLVIFVIALILHESGHLLAMKAFGYQDASVLFVPFMGALATARKTNATLTQKFWVSFAGPLPGLIIGIGLAIAAQNQSYPAWASDAGWIFISLNLFNLLPVYPLDGGQIADLLVFSRSPYLGLIFKVIGVLFLLFLGLGNSLLWIFALVMALTIPFSFRTDKLTAKIRRELSNLSFTRDEETLLFIFEKMKQLGYSNLPFSKRYVLAKGLLDRHQEVKAKWATRLVLSVLYVLSLFGGITGAMYAFMPELGTVLIRLAEHSKAAQQQQVKQANEAIRANPKDIKAYQKRARAFIRLDNPQSALADYDQLIQLDSNNPSHYMARAGIWEGLKDYQGAIQEYDRLLKIKPNHLPAYQLRAEIRLSLKDYQAALQDYSKLIQLGDKTAYIERGRIRLLLKDYKGAIAEVNPLIQQAPNDFPEAYDLRSQAKRKLGDETGATSDREKARMLYQLHDQEDLSLSEEE